MRQKLQPEQVKDALTQLPGWTATDELIQKEFQFKTYKDGLVFACAVGFLADGMDHHPDMTVGYQKVKIQLNTHDANGVTEMDIRLATQIEGLGAK
jgi:4a-hydroxytetrahydrobiopterin dehydratase